MKKIFRMANAELNKIFMRPSMFVLVSVLVVALVFSFIFFAPTSSGKKFTYDLTNTTNIYTAFEGDHYEIYETLINTKKSIDEYMDESNNTSNKFKTMFQAAKDQFIVLHNTVINMDKTSLKPSNVTIAKVATELNYFSSQIKTIRDFMLEKVKEKNVNFFLKTSDYEKIYKTIKNIYDNLPTTNDIYAFNTQDIIDRFNLLAESYDLDKINKQIQNLEEINIDNEKLVDLLNTYYYSNIAESPVVGVESYTQIGRLNQLYNDVVNYYLENPDTANKEIIYNLNELIAKYYDYVQICNKLILNNFELLRIGSKSDKEISSYNGFSGISVYNLNKEIATAKYFHDNNTFGYEYLTGFNFNTNSGTTTNVYDFTFYALQILSTLIILFVIFFVSSGISGEQNSGVLKMAAVRPYTRNKLYSGKFIACFNVALILMLVSFAASFAVGLATFGLTTQNVLIVMNAQTVVVMHPLVVMLLQFVSLLIDVVFYISLSLLISLLIKPTTINTAISSSIFLTSTILNGVVTSSWIRFIPSLNLGMFKYFTNSQTRMFSYSIVPDMNLFYSIVVIIISIFTFDIAGRLIFKQKHLDK